MKPARIPARPDAQPEQPLDAETRRILEDRLAEPGPLRPWSDFEAEESRRKPEPPLPR